MIGVTPMQIKQYLKSILSYNHDKNTTHSSKPKDILISAKNFLGKPLHERGHL